MGSGGWQFPSGEPGTGDRFLPALVDFAGISFINPASREPFYRARVLSSSTVVEPLFGWSAVYWRGAGECPEWQRELTVNQPPYGFEGSSPSSPTILSPLINVDLTGLGGCIRLVHDRRSP